MITVIDYGMGNLRSVSKALEHLGAEVRVSSDARDIENAAKVVLPGVGAFKDAVEGLTSRGLAAPILAHIARGKPFLGICLGLQLLFEESQENPGIRGLAVYAGSVVKFKPGGVKVPHMGWNNVGLRADHPLLKGIPDESYFYFVHSFYARPRDPEVTAGECQYGGENVTAIVARDNVFATQFHPEKSQEAGLGILRNFVKWKTA